MSKIDELLKKVGADFGLDDKRVKATVSTDGQNIVNIRIEVLEDESELARKESEAFQEYVKTLPDDIFVAVCEILGNNEINKIDKCIFSDNLETVRSGAFKFKAVLKNYLLAKKNELEDILASC